MYGASRECGSSPVRNDVPSHGEMVDDSRFRGVAYSADADHQFQQADHRFQSKPITLEERRSIGALRVRVFGVEV